MKFKLFKIDFDKIGVFILSNAHIESIRRRPLLYKMIFKGKVICTEETLGICNNMIINFAYT
ncbi:hypothetical protein [Clostridium sp. Marseille-QA1073]